MPAIAGSAPSRKACARRSRSSARPCTALASGVRALAAFGGGTAVVNRLSLVGAFFVVFIPASFSLVLALESFVGERERTTLEVLLSTPLREAEIYAGKVAAVLTVSLSLCYGGLIVYCLIAFPGLGYFPLGILLALALSSLCQVAAMVARGDHQPQ